MVSQNKLANTNSWSWKAVTHYLKSFSAAQHIAEWVKRCPSIKTFSHWQIAYHLGFDKEKSMTNFLCVHRKPYSYAVIHQFLRGSQNLNFLWLVTISVDQWTEISCRKARPWTVFHFPQLGEPAAAVAVCRGCRRSGRGHFTGCHAGDPYGAWQLRRANRQDVRQQRAVATVASTPVVTRRHFAGVRPQQRPGTWNPVKSSARRQFKPDSINKYPVKRLENLLILNSINHKPVKK